MAHPSEMSRHVGTCRVPCGMLELALRTISLRTCFCALSRYGVTTVRSFPLADSFFSGIRDVCSDQDRLFRAESLRCFRRTPLTFGSSTIRSASSRWTSLGVALSRSSQRSDCSDSWTKEVGFRRYKPILVFLTDTSIALPRFCPKAHKWAEVPNRGVDWSSRPRRACYPWGNFSVTSSPQQ